MTRNAEKGSRPSLSVVAHVFICPSVRLRDLCGSVGKNRASIQHLENQLNLEAVFGQAKMSVAHMQNAAFLKKPQTLFNRRLVLATFHSRSKKIKRITTR